MCVCVCVFVCVCVMHAYAYDMHARMQVLYCLHETCVLAHKYCVMSWDTFLNPTHLPSSLGEMPSSFI